MSTNNDTEPITHAEALAVTRALIDAASTMSVLVKYGYTTPSGAIRGYTVAKQCRAAADFLDVMHKASKPADILRRAADQIDPPTVPAEPDLTTPEGWLTACAVKDYDPRLVVLPGGDAQRSALVATWGMTEADAPEFPWLASCIAADAFGLSKHQ